MDSLVGGEHVCILLQKAIFVDGHHHHDLSPTCYLIWSVLGKDCRGQGAVKCIGKTLLVTLYSYRLVVEYGYVSTWYYTRSASTVYLLILYIYIIYLFKKKLSPGQVSQKKNEKNLVYYAYYIYRIMHIWRVKKVQSIV